MLGMYQGEDDIMRTIRQNVAHMTISSGKANPCCNELDETQELHYPAIMKAIAAKNYDSYVGQEFSPRNGADWSRSLEATYRVCDV